MTERIAWCVVGIVVGVVLLQSLGGAEVISYPEVIVHTREIEAREPPARPPTIIERIVYRNIPPVQLARALEGGRPDVAAFCRPVVVSTTDTLEVLVPDPMLLLRSGSWSDSWWGPDRLRLTGPTNAGELLEYSFRPRGSFDFVADGDSIIVRSKRLNFVRDSWELGAQVWTLVSIARALAGAR